MLEWMPNLQLATSLPSRSVPRARSYAHVIFEPSTSLIVAASSLKATFASFDEEGNKIWEPDGEYHLILISDILSNPLYSAECLQSIVRVLNNRSDFSGSLGHYGRVMLYYMASELLLTVHVFPATNLPLMNL